MLRGAAADRTGSTCLVYEKKRGGGRQSLPLLRHEREGHRTCDIHESTKAQVLLTSLHVFRGGQHEVASYYWMRERARATKGHQAPRLEEALEVVSEWISQASQE